jgi:hypothetical protein
MVGSTMDHLLKPDAKLSPEAPLRTSDRLLVTDQSEKLKEVFAGITSEFRKNAELFHDALQPFRDFQAQFAQAARIAFEPYLRLMQTGQQFAAAVHEASEPLRRIQGAFATIPPEQLSILHQAMAGLADDLKFRWDKVEGPVFKTFAKIGLTGLESYVTRSEILHVAKLSKEKGNKAVQKYIFRKFKKDKYRLLNLMMRSWWSLPYMRKRKRIVRAAVSAHKRRQYDLAIPTLLPLIDGLAFGIAAGTASLGKKVIYAKDVAVAYNTEEAEVWSECVEQVVCALVYKEHDVTKLKKRPSSVNRHAVLHGRIVGYGSELNSYRIILLLNVMVNIAKQKVK